MRQGVPRESAIASAMLASLVAVATAAHQGVPRIDPDYTVEVDQWWTTHPFNPESPKYDPLIVSPEPVVRLASGQSIQDAIDKLPEGGGTIRLGPGAYGGFQLIARSNVHIIADGKVVVKGAFRYAGNRWAVDYGSYDRAVSRRGNRIKEVWEAHKRPTRNYYIKGITFDGGGTRTTAIVLQRVYDVVIDDCVFENFHNPKAHHPGTILGHEGLNNVWCRNCTFRGAGVFASYLDGAHGSGMINCTVEIDRYNGGFLYLTNDDFTEDINENGRTDREEERTAKYIVVYGCTYNGDNRGGCALQVTGENVLFVKNKVNGTLRYLVGCDPRWTDSDPEICYRFYGFKVIGNAVKAVTDAVLLSRNLALISCPPHIKMAPRMGKATIQGNTLESCPRLLKEITLPHPDMRKEGARTAEFDGPNVLRDNTVAGRRIAEGDIVALPGRDWEAAPPASQGCDAVAHIAPGR